MIMEKTVENLENDELFDDDYGKDLDNQDTQNEEDTQNQEDETQTEESSDDADSDDLITTYLKSKGIDANSIKMENEDGETEELNFNDLSKEEQLQLLNYNPNETQEPVLADDEAQLLGILRQNNMSVQDYLNAYKKHVIEEFQAANPSEPQESYSVDDYTDEELFVADLKDKIPDLTEEEAAKALETEQQNPELFQKKVAGLRASYQAQEKSMREAEAAELQKVQEQQAAQFESVIVDTIQRNNSIDLGDTSLELSEDDMNEIASFILDSDAAGVRHIAKALNDPRTLVEMAWWALKGHDALNQVTQYYKRQIAEARKSAKASASAGRTKPTTVVTKPTNKRTNVTRSEGIVNAEDLLDNLV